VPRKYDVAVNITSNASRVLMFDTIAVNINANASWVLLFDSVAVNFSANASSVPRKYDVAVNITSNASWVLLFDTVAVNFNVNASWVPRKYDVAVNMSCEIVLVRSIRSFQHDFSSNALLPLFSCIRVEREHPRSLSPRHNTINRNRANLFASSAKGFALISLQSIT
jgi:hypothetical protein